MSQVITHSETRTESPSTPPGSVDFDLFGVVGVRLLNATTGDVKAVTRQLGPSRSSLVEQPDIIIRFTNRIELSEHTNYIGANETASCNHDFLILQHNRIDRKIQIPFDQLGNQCELVCETGFPVIPMLMEMVNLTALNKGYIPVHASGCCLNGTGILTTGWTGGGKTGILLSLMANGAQFVSDDVVYLSPDGSEMFGLQQTIHVKDHYLAELPAYQSVVNSKDLLRMRGARWLQTLGQMMPGFVSNRLCSQKMQNRLNNILQGKRAVHMTPQALFGSEACLPFCSLDKVVVATSHNQSHVSLERSDAEAVAERMLASTVHESQELQSYYLKYRFAFPERRNELIEQSEQLQRDALLRILQGKETYLLRHPYPASIPELYKALQPLGQ